MIKKIILVDPSPQEDVWIRDDKLRIRVTVDPYVGTSVVIREPFGIEYIAGFLEKNGYSTHIMWRTTEDEAVFAKEIARLDPGLIGVGIHASYLHDYAIKLCDELDNLLPDVPLVVGGYHPTGYPQFLTHARGIDFATLREAEHTILELVQAIEKGKNTFGDIAGLVWRDGERIITNKPRERIDFKELPWPKREPDILKFTKGAPLAYPPPEQQKAAAQIAYSRGCPFNCPYCPSMQVFPGKVSFRDPDDVVEEIKWLKSQYGTNYLFFTDLTFTLYKSKVEKLLDSFQKHKISDTWWFAYATVDSINKHPELVKRMAEAGCTRLGIGIEAIQGDALTKIKPRLQYRNVQEIKEALDVVNDCGILVRGYFMVGWPWESQETLDMLQDLLMRGQFPIDQIRLAFAVPFPGTPIYSQYNEFIEEKDFSRYTADVPVFKTKIEKEHLQQRTSQMVADYYSSQAYKEHVARKKQSFPHLEKSYDYFFAYLRKRGILS